MSITTITVGGNPYTAYASVAEADAYLAVDPVRSAAWAALSVDDKSGYLIAATRRLDLLDWAGEKTGGAAQLADWPRTGLKYDDGTSVPDDEVPQAVEDATIVLAGSIASDSTLADAGTSGTNIKRVQAGSAGVTFFRPTEGAALQDETAYAMVWPFLAASDSTGLGALASGTGQKSSFDEDDPFGLREGYP